MSLAQASYVTITPYDKPLTGHVRVPGSKSLTNRALILATLANGVSTLHHVLLSDDTKVMIEALTQMGVGIEFETPTTIKVTATGQLDAPTDPLFLGNAGTATRFLTAICALVDGQVVIDGDAYMRQRPIMPLVNALKDLGVDATCETGCPPVIINGKGGFTGNEVVIDGNLSSQYVSALLMLAPFSHTDTFTVKMQDAHIGGQGYIGLTLDLMQTFGVATKNLENGWSVLTQPSYTATDYDVEPDASSMTYIWAMEALTEGHIDTSCDPYKMTQPDAKVYDLIRQFPNFPDVIDGSQFQDAVPTLAVMSAFSGKQVRFTGIENLRVKECDRTAALREGLNKIHPDLAVEDGDDLVVDGRIDLKGLQASGKLHLNQDLNQDRNQNQNQNILIDSKDDHRIAMSFALAGLLLSGISIRNPACVAKTYPDYWQTLEQLGVSLSFHS